MVSRNSQYFEINGSQVSNNVDLQKCKNDSGVKKWIGGRFIVSSGTREFDELLGGGISLGSLTLLQSDNFTDYANTFISYQMAEALSMEHKVILITDTVDIINQIQKLPYNINLGAMSKVNSSSSDVGNSNSVSKSNDCNLSENLKIAWQYEKYINNVNNSYSTGSNLVSVTPINSSFGRNNSRHVNPFNTERDSVDNRKMSEELKNTFCCSYDLSRRLQSELLENSNLETTYYDNKPDDEVNIFESIIRKISIFLNDSISNHIVRIFIPNLEKLLDFSNYSLTSKQFAQSFLRLKHIIRDSPTQSTLTVSCHLPSVPTTISTYLSQISDNVLHIESFAGRCNSVPYEFKDFHGLLLVKRLQCIGVLAPHRPRYDRYGLKRDRRKLHIEPLHMPPEESRTFGTSSPDTHLNSKSVKPNASGLINSVALSHSSIPDAAVSVSGVETSQKNQKIHLQLETSSFSANINQKQRVESSSIDDSKKKTIAESFAAAKIKRESLKLGLTNSKATTSTSSDKVDCPSTKRDLDF